MSANVWCFKSVLSNTTRCLHSLGWKAWGGKAAVTAALENPSKRKLLPVRRTRAEAGKVGTGRLLPWSKCGTGTEERAGTGQQWIKLAGGPQIAVSFAALNAGLPSLSLTKCVQRLFSAFCSLKEQPYHASDGFRNCALILKELLSSLFLPFPVFFCPLICINLSHLQGKDDTAAS